MKSYTIVGAGNFGSSLQHQLQYHKHRVSVYNHKMKATLPNLLVYSDAVIISVKPDKAEEVCVELRNAVDINRPLFISAMAGVSLDFLRRHLNTERVVRIMCDLSHTTQSRDIFAFLGTDDKNFKIECSKYISDLGAITFLNSDEEIDKATALIGCGPAFVASYMKGYIKVFDETVSVADNGYVSRLFSRTLNDINLYSSSPERIIERVASKGGATQQALASLNPVEECIRNAVQKAEEKCREIRLSTSTPP